MNNNSVPQPRPDQPRIGQGNEKAYIAAVIIFVILGVFMIGTMIYMGVHQ